MHNKIYSSVMQNSEIIYGEKKIFLWSAYQLTELSSPYDQIYRFVIVNSNLSYIVISLN